MGNINLNEAKSEMESATELLQNAEAKVERAHGFMVWGFPKIKGSQKHARGSPLLLLAPELGGIKRCVASRRGGSGMQGFVPSTT